MSNRSSRNKGNKQTQNIRKSETSKVGVKLVGGGTSGNSLTDLIMKSQLANVQKASIPLAEPDENYYEIIAPPYSQFALSQYREQSTILNQCVDAYSMNIAGFGVQLEYIDEVEETPEMKAEWDMVQDLLEDFSLDMDFKDVWALAISNRETTGNGWIEVIRNGKGLPVEIKSANPRYMWITMLGEPIQVNRVRKGKQFSYFKQFRRYVQMNMDGKYIWFKEFGDPRIMDYRTGEYVNSLEEQYQANELIHLKVDTGYSPYGIPRWVSHIVHMSGARQAEELNLNYFTNGRHIPMAIILNGCQLTEDSESIMGDYAKSLQGVDNAHKFMILEAEAVSNDPTANSNASIKLEPLSQMLQDDGLFLKYDEQSRKKVQSAFRLQDLYVGLSSDFNRATAEVARQVTEEQVFIPEREKLESIINKQLLADYQLKYVRVKFKQPEISTAQEKALLLRELVNAGALAPNDLRDEAGKLLGKSFEELPLEEANIPIAISKIKAGIADPAIAPDQSMGAPTSDLTSQVSADSTANDQLDAFGTGDTAEYSNPGVPESGEFGGTV